MLIHIYSYAIGILNTLYAYKYILYGFINTVYDGTHMQYVFSRYVLLKYSNINTLFYITLI